VVVGVTELVPAGLSCWFCTHPAVTIGYGFAICGGREETPINCSERARVIAVPAGLERRAQAVRDAWQVAQADDHLQPQGFGWPGDLYDALEAL
jgi:hypothetical protein